MKKSFLIATALLGTLGISGAARSFTGNQPQRPVATMPQHSATAVAFPDQIQESNATANDPLNDTDTEVQDDQVPQALKDVSEYGERVYDMAKVADWANAQADLATLQQSAQQLSQQVSSNGSGIVQLTSSLDRINQSVAAKNQQMTQLGANQVTLLAITWNPYLDCSDPITKER